MTRYFIEDTSDGYIFGVEFPIGNRQMVLPEVGGHGPVEKLYAEVSKLYTDRRAHNEGVLHRIVPPGDA